MHTANANILSSVPSSIPRRSSQSSLAAPVGPDSQDLQHMGMWVEGIQPAAPGSSGGERLLVARNKATGRRWIVDPVTGIGEPEALPEPQEAHTDELLPAEEFGRSGGPFPCEHCGKCKMLVLRLPDRSVMKKCLSCRRFVVDGRVERAPRWARGESAPRRRRAGRLPSTPISLPLPQIS